MEIAHTQSILARERVVRKSIFLLQECDAFVEPVPARANQLEFEPEIKRHAFAQHVFQRVGKRDLEIRVHHERVFQKIHRSSLHFDALRVNGCRECGKRKPARRKRDKQPCARALRQPSAAARRKNRHA